MDRPIRLSHTCALILQSIRHGYRYGFDIMDVTGLPSGTVYPALRRLERDQLIQSKWESEALAKDRPPRPGQENSGVMGPPLLWPTILTRAVAMIWPAVAQPC